MSNHASTLQTYFERLNAKDLDGVMALFAEDIVLEDPVGKPNMPQSGLEQIRARYAQVLTHARFEVIGSVRGSFGNFAAACVNAFTAGQMIELISVAEFNSAGKIRHYRVYFGPENILDAG